MRMKRIRRMSRIDPNTITFRAIAFSPLFFFLAFHIIAVLSPGARTDPSRPFNPPHPLTHPE
jgi:hypothetical protein